ncbi:MAG: hypothetical protein L0228_01570 [Planctomycetes bacterium]|nr:hypothetical protein [Planctomycetota bacterium]
MPKKKASRKSKQSVRRREKLVEFHDAPLVDRRAIEGVMRQLAPTLTGANSAVADAQQIMYQAFDEPNLRRQVALARKALEISPDCADAHVLLAEHAQSLPEALEFYEQGVAAGERALGKEGFQEYDGHFWGFLETRPYMRAREGLANCLWASGRREDAASHCREMLRLNPNDNQGIRYRLASMLLDLERHDDLHRLLQEYENDASAEWTYTRALLAFRQEGDTQRSRTLLLEAQETNGHAPAYLTGDNPMPAHAPDYITMGGEDEAVCYAAQFLPAWKDTPGATVWLRKTLKIPVAARADRKRDAWSKVRLVLTRLPQHESDVWEIDLRGITAPANGDHDINARWALVIASATEERVLAFEIFDDHPKDGEVWNLLTDAMRQPHDGEPHRPAEIRLARKVWFRSWKSKLQQIGVECQLSDSLEQVDRLLADVTPRFEEAQRMASGASPAEQDWSTIAALPQRLEETWQAVVRRLPAWIQVAGEPIRPWVFLLADVASDAILATEIVSEEPHDDWFLQGIWQAIHQPALGEPHLPGVIQVASDQQRDALAARLEYSGVQCIATKNLEHARRLVGELADHLEGDHRRSALVHSPGVTPSQLGGFFAAAADFYRSRPWRQVPGDTIIRVACDKFDSGPWYAVVMGQSGMQLGLALYEDLGVLRTILRGEFTDEETARMSTAFSVTYSEAFEIAPEDLDAAEENDWPIAGPEAYPSVLRVNPGLAVRTPLKWELELLEACLRAIPEFLSQCAGSARIPAAISGSTLTLELARLEDDEPTV